MIELRNIDLIIIDCLEPLKAVDTLDICTKNILFGNSIVFTDKKINSGLHNLIKIDKIDTIEKYSDFCLTLNNYINNEYVLIVQNDGFILNASLWNDDFFKYDYIGAPWKQTCMIGQKVGNGGFSLRSKKFLEFSCSFETTEGIPEDNFLCIHNYHAALDYGINYAESFVANNFAFEYPNIYRENFYPENHFGFHGKHHLEVVHKYIKN